MGHLRRRASIHLDLEVGDLPVEGEAFGVAQPKLLATRRPQGAARTARSLIEDVRIFPQEDRCDIAQEGSVLGADHHTTTAGDHARRSFLQGVAQGSVFQVPEVLLPPLGEDLRYPLAGPLYDGTVEVDVL